MMRAASTSVAIGALVRIVRGKALRPARGEKELKRDASPFSDLAGRVLRVTAQPVLCGKDDQPVVGDRALEVVERDPALVQAG